MSQIRRLRRDVGDSEGMWETLGGGGVTQEGVDLKGGKFKMGRDPEERETRKRGTRKGGAINKRLDLSGRRVRGRLERRERLGGGGDSKGVDSEGNLRGGGGGKR